MKHRKSAVYAAFLIFLALSVSSCARPPKKKPGLPPSPVSIAAPAAFYHTVSKGETLYRISKLYQADVKELMRVNGIFDVSKLEVGQRLYIPKVIPPPIPAEGGVYSPADFRRILGAADTRSIWRTITVHHSGTLQGGAKSFNRDHMRRGMGGLFYHFVIGNGTQSRDGEIEVGWRWKRRVKANRPYDIQICVVGDFNRQQVSSTQFASLAGLIQTLRGDYGIPIEGVRRHEDIPGKHTACPGRHFPFSKLLSALRGG